MKSHAVYFEAFVGAIFIDKGIDEVKKFFGTIKFFETIEKLNSSKNLQMMESYPVAWLIEIFLTRLKTSFCSLISPEYGYKIHLMSYRLV
jgi:dsRNA-specific ribonuclease